MHIYGIAAMTPTGIIGRADGSMPWHIPEDFAIFKQVTMGHTIIMGRKTYESIGKPLPGRRTIVVTTRPNFKPEGVITVSSLDDIWQHAPEQTTDDAIEGTNIPHMIVCGGGQIYEQLLPRMKIIHVSTIYEPVAVKSGDVLFPEFKAEFPEYIHKMRFPNFDYGIYIRDQGQEVPTPDIKYPNKPTGGKKTPQLVTV
jgi:dihydrofolate reductase